MKEISRLTFNNEFPPDNGVSFEMCDKAAPQSPLLHLMTSPVCIFAGFTSPSSFTATTFVFTEAADECRTEADSVVKELVEEASAGST